MWQPGIWGDLHLSRQILYSALLQSPQCRSSRVCSQDNGRSTITHVYDIPDESASHHLLVVESELDTATTYFRIQLMWRVLELIHRPSGARNFCNFTSCWHRAVITRAIHPPFLHGQWQYSWSDPLLVSVFPAPTCSTGLNLLGSFRSSRISGRILLHPRLLSVGSVTALQHIFYLFVL